MSSRGQSLSMFVVQRTFTRVRRGYDPEEVDRHLERVSRWFTGAEVHELITAERQRLEERAAALDAREAALGRDAEGARIEAEATLEGARRRADATLQEADQALVSARDRAHEGVAAEREAALAAVRAEAAELAAKLSAEATEVAAKLRADATELAGQL